MKTIMSTLALGSCFLLNAPVFAEEPKATPPSPSVVLERGGTITGVELTNSTIKIDGKTYIVYPQTQIYLNNDGTQVPVSSLKDVELNKASVYYDLDGKGQLTILSITPAKPKLKEATPNAKPQ